MTTPVYSTLEALAESEAGRIKDDKTVRPYRMKIAGKYVYVMANSPGNAALAACKVETCTTKEVQAALINVLCQKVKQENATDAKD